MKLNATMTVVDHGRDAAQTPPAEPENRRRKKKREQQRERERDQYIAREVQRSDDDRSAGQGLQRL